MRYTEVQLKEMATVFLGMYNANVDVPETGLPHMILQILCQIYNIPAQEALDKIKQLAENGTCD